MRPSTSTLVPMRLLSTIPQPPGNIVGTVNDPVPVPAFNKAKGSYHWTFERLLSVAVAPLIVVPFATGSLSPILDATLCSLLLVHSHIGFESCIVDYIPKRKFGGLHNLAIYALFAGTTVGLVGLYEYETNDVGVTETLKRAWNA